jgi:hypothetical protein
LFFVVEKTEKDVGEESNKQKPEKKNNKKKKNRTTPIKLLTGKCTNDCKACFCI